MAENDDKYGMGFSFLDQMKFCFRTMIVLFIFFQGAFILLFFFLFIFTSQEEFLFLILLVFILTAFLFWGILAPIIIFTFSMQFLVGKNLSRNYVEFKRTRLRIVRQTAPRAPRFTIEIPYTLMERALKVDDRIILEWKRGSKWFHRLGIRYTPAHGHMYNIMSGADNLIILYLKKKMELRNYDHTDSAMKQAPIRTKKVHEIVIDIEKKRQQEFIRRLDEEIVKGRVRMIDIRKGKIQKEPRVARPPPKLDM